MGDVAAGASAHAKTAVREPTTLAMLAVLPPFVTYVYGAAMQSFPDVGFLAVEAATYGRIGGALFATAFLTGLVGLFGTVSAATADRYLAFSGFDARVLFGTRVLVSTGVAFAAAAVSLGSRSRSAPTSVRRSPRTSCLCSPARSTACSGSSWAPSSPANWRGRSCWCSSRTWTPFSPGTCSR
jgi:hypothetical protein